MIVVKCFDKYSVSLTFHNSYEQGLLRLKATAGI